MIVPMFPQLARLLLLEVVVDANDDIDAFDEAGTSIRCTSCSTISKCGETV